nr:BapA/Bap/LapF family large adhesin [Acinetobacter sp. YH12133]
MTDLEVPAVNDQDGNGIDDATDSLIADAEAAVAAAETAYAEAEQAIADADTDGNGLITPAEQAVAQAAIDEAAELKAIAQNAVNALPAEVQAEKDGLQGRLDDLIPLTAPVVTDADGNGIDDAFEAAEALVTDAENAHQAAEDVIAGAQEDGLISPAEQQAIQDAVDAATEAEQTAQDAVTALPESTDKDGLQDRLDALTDLEVPAVNDQDGNGIDDATDSLIADAEAAVAAAEAAYAEAEQAIADADTDGNGLITPAEQAVAQAAIDEAAELKAIAQNAVNALPTEVQVEKDGLQDRLDDLIPLTAPVVQIALDDNVNLDMGNEITTTEPAVVDENVQVINLLESTGGADAGTEVVLSGSINSLAISISQTSLLAVADAYRVDVLDENGNIVYSAVTQDSELVGDVAGLGILGITGDNTLTATVSDLPAGTYRVVVSNDAGALTNLLDTDGGGISLQELGDAGVLLGADNQQVVLDAVNNALGGGAIAALVTEVILPPVLTLVNGLPVDELVGALNDSLLSNADAISLLGFSVTGLLDTIVDAAATALLSNTLTLLQETSITTQVTSTIFENYSVDNNVLTNDENPELATVTHIQFGDGAAQEVTTGGVSINGEYGVLTIFADGSYEYIGNGDFESIGKSEVFTYTILGADGVTTDSATLTINILDDYAPDVPVINPVSATGDITGTAEAGSTVVVTDDNNNEIGRTVVRADGLWSITNPGLTDGAVLNVIAIDAAGNPSQAASTSVDAQAPITTLVTNTTGDSTPTLQGTIDDPTATVVVTVDSINYTAVNNGDGTWTLADGQLPELADGSYNVTVQAIDAAGNESTITDSLVVEAVLFANDDLNNVNVLDTVIENNLTDSGFIFGLAGANVLSELAEIDLSAGGFNFTVAPDTTQDVLIDVNGTTGIDLSALVNSIGALLGQTLSADLMLVNLDTGEIVTTVENALQLTPALLTTVMTAENIEFTDIPEGNYTIAFSSPSGDGALSQLLRAIADVGLLSGVNISIETSTQYSTADATGNILGNGVDTDVADIGEGLTVTQVISAETTHAVNTPIATDNTETAISGNYGILYMQADGSYRYVSNGNINDVGKVDTFTYTVADAAGNTSQAYLNIRTDAEGSTIDWDENDLQADGVITVDAVDDDATVKIAQTNSVSELLPKVQVVDAQATGTNGPITGSVVTNTTWTNTYTLSESFNITENTVANGTLTITAELLGTALNTSVTEDWGEVTATYTIIGQSGEVTTGILTLTDSTQVVDGYYTVSIPLNDLIAGEYILNVNVENITTNTGAFGATPANNGEFTVDTTLSVIETSLNDFTTIEGIYSEEGNLLEEDIVSNVATFTIQQGAETYRFENGHIYQNDVLLQNQDSVNITGTYGILNVDASGKYTYTTQDGSGIGQKESFTYTVNDVGGLSDTANLNIGIGASITGSRYDDSYSSYGGVADTVIYNVLEGAETDATGGNGTDTWTDFNATEGDSIDISALLGEQSVTSETLGNFVTLEQRGEHTVVTIDRDGSATDTTYAKTDLIILENTTASNLVLDDLIKYNQI